VQGAEVQPKAVEALKYLRACPPWARKFDFSNKVKASEQSVDTPRQVSNLTNKPLSTNPDKLLIRAEAVALGALMEADLVRHLS
jgi:hypothetical protein